MPRRNTFSHITESPGLVEWKTKDKSKAALNEETARQRLHRIRKKGEK